MRIFGLLVCLALSSSAWAYNKVEKLIQEYDLEPLGASEFWEQNHTLPYEECLVIGSDGHRLKGVKTVVGVGGQIYRQNVMMFCYSTQLKTAFMVPLILEQDHSVGVDINFTPISISSGHMKKLGAKSLIDIFGEYKGFSGGIGLGMAASGALLWNKQTGTKLTLNESGSLTVGQFGASYRKLHVGTRKLEEDEVYSAYYIQRREMLLEAAKQHIEDVYIRGEADEYLHMLENERLDFQNWTDSKKYATTWKYWVHHLSPRSTSFLEKHKRPCCQAQEGSSQQEEFAKLFGDLDIDFLASLKIQKIKKS